METHNTQDCLPLATNVSTPNVTPPQHSSPDGHSVSPPLQFSTSTPVPQSNDVAGHPSLGSALISISTGVQSTMSSLHNLQVAIINANGGRNLHQFRDVFTQLQQSLHREWEGIIRFLHQCYDFSLRAARLRDGHRAFSDEEFSHYFRELINLSGTLLSSSQVVLSLHQQISVQVTRLAPHLSCFLRRSGKPRRTPVYQVISEHPQPASASKKTDVRHDFVQSNLLAAYPDGPAALASSIEALYEIFIGISIMSQVWASVYERHQFLVRDDFQQEQSLLDGWAEDTELILSAIAYLKKMSDAITIDAVAPRPKHRGRKSSRETNDTSLPICSSGMQRRNTSSSWGKEVFTRWDLFFGLRRRR
ncbi:hypothetical protein D9615_004295 [Tricholomella constricta]|uniref:Uncharacterized protein n=1 Tax=Tricholomella constricta TaxID=117010 RepID=A0A8H5HFD5_9AGAR|nr:hypothetical protein D9615_004295 [Tricholomella constricta]